MKPDKKDPPEGERAEQQAKKPYVAPQMTVHGTVAEITQAINPGSADGLGGSLPK